MSRAWLAAENAAFLLFARLRRSHLECHEGVVEIGFHLPFSLAECVGFDMCYRVKMSRIFVFVSPG